MNVSNPSLYDNVTKSMHSAENEEPTDISALASFAHATRFMTRIGTFRTGALEPLPFTDYNLFKDNYTRAQLSIHINPFLVERHTFLPNVPIKVNVTAMKKKDFGHIIHPYMYTL